MNMYAINKLTRIREKQKLEGWERVQAPGPIEYRRLYSMQVQVKSSPFCDIKDLPKPFTSMRD